MANNDLRTRYTVARGRLYDLVDARNKLLDELEELFRPAQDLTVRTRLVAEIDTAWARELLDRVDALMPEIDQAMAHTNRLGQRIAKPGIRWGKMILPKR